MKTCKKCNETKPANRDNFGSTPSGNLRGTCRACMRKHTSKHSKANPEMVKARAAKRGIHTLNINTNKLLKKQAGMCVYCKVELSSKYEIDHILPVVKGGNDDASNLQILCPQCNREKHNKNHEEHLKWRELNKHLLQ